MAVYVKTKQGGGGGRGRERGGTLFQRKSSSVVPIYSVLSEEEKFRCAYFCVGLCSSDALRALSLPLNSSLRL